MDNAPINLGPEWSKLHMPPEQITEYDQAVYEFDQTRAAFLEACTKHAQANSVVSKQKMDECQEALELAFGATVRSILASGESGNACFAAIANLIVDDDTARVKHFQELTGSDDFCFLKDDNTPCEDHLRRLSIITDTSDFAKAATGWFKPLVQGDLETFKLKINELKPPVKTTATYETMGRQELLQQLGSHCTAAAQIGARLVSGSIAEFRRRWLH